MIAVVATRKSYGTDNRIRSTGRPLSRQGTASTSVLLGHGALQPDADTIVYFFVDVLNAISGERSGANSQMGATVLATLATAPRANNYRKGEWLRNQ